MAARDGRRFRPLRRSDQLLVLAIVVSLALHWLLLAGAWLPLPREGDEPEPLEVRLAPLPPQPAAATPRAAPPPHRPLPQVHARTPRAEPRPAPRPAPVIAASAPAVAPADVEEGIADDVPSAALEAAVRAQAPEPAAAEPAPVRSLPRKGRITYTFLYGSARYDVGKAVQSWEVDSGSYRLASDAQTTGVVEFFRPQRMRYVSKGKVTRQGLRPDSFLVSRTRRGQTEAAQARFDWNAGSLTYGVAAERTSVSLPAGTQDLMSFIYQLAVAPPEPGRYRMPIATGSRFETYEIEVRAEEQVETPLGTLRALPVRQQRRAGAESIEIWLAAEYRYLPVRIRYFDRDGQPAGEQLASEIRISDE